jgi:hypothetical protein
MDKEGTSRCVRFVVLKMMTMSIMIFWDVMPYRSIITTVSEEPAASIFRQKEAYKW